MSSRRLTPLFAICLTLGLIAGLVARSTANLQTPTPIALPLYTTPANFGAVGDGKTDDTQAILAAIAGTPDNGCLLIPPGAAYVITAPLYIFSRDGLCIRSLGSTDTEAIGKRGAEFIWKGPAGAAALFDVNCSRKIVLENVSLSCDGNSTPPACGIRFDMRPDVTSRKATVNCTRCVVRGCTIISPPGVATFSGVSISQVSRINCEFIRVEDTVIQPSASQPNSGEGVHVDNSANAKGIRCRDVSVSYANIGFHWLNGSGHLDGCTGTACNVFVQADNFCDPLTIRNCNAEQAGQAISLNGQDSPALLESNRFVVTGATALNLHNRQTMMIGNRFTGLPAKGQPAVVGFTSYPGTAFGISRNGNLWSVITGNDGWCAPREVGAVEWERQY
jgi:hypothetical protein